MIMPCTLFLSFGRVAYLSEHGTTRTMIFRLNFEPLEPREFTFDEQKFMTA